MDGYCNFERVRQAFALGEALTTPVGSRQIDKHMLLTLARKMGGIVKGKIVGIPNGCRASLQYTLEPEMSLGRKAIASSLTRLIASGIITKTMDRDRRADGDRPLRGRKPSNGSEPGQWEHCVYHLVPAVWDAVVYDERPVREVAPISTEVSAADQAVLESFDEAPSTVAPESKSAISNEDFDTLLKLVNVKFVDHKVWDLANHRDLVGNAIHELGRRSIQAGHLYRGVEFLDWLYMHRRSAFDFLEISDKFGGAFLKVVTDNWDQFIDSGYKDDQYYDHSTEECAGTPDDVEQADYEKYVSDLLINHFTKHETAPEIPEGMCKEIVRRSLCAGGIHQAGDFVRWVRGECPRYSIDEVNEQLDSLWWDFRHPNAVDELE